MKIAMIPARLGSRRLQKKNLREINGEPLIVWAIRKCRRAGVFDQIWVNSEADEFATIAESEGVSFHRRPPDLANDVATSEEFVLDFLKRHPCDYLFQVHGIAPLLTATDVRAFVEHMSETGADTLLSCTNEQLECAINGRPINFTFNQKTNSQGLEPVQRICWSITGWRAASFLNSAAAGRTATYSGKVGFFPVNRVAGLVIKTEEDLKIAKALWHLVHGKS